MIEEDRVPQSPCTYKAISRFGCDEVRLRWIWNRDQNLERTGSGLEKEGIQFHFPQSKRYWDTGTFRPPYDTPTSHLDKSSLPSKKGS